MSTKKKLTTIPVIKMTRNYALFEKHGDNRKLKLTKHKKLFNSMEKKGFFPFWPVIVGDNGNGKLKIHDGQHRVEIAESSGLPIYYIISDQDFNIAEINDTQKTWDTLDYAEVYAAQGIKAYQEGLAFMTEHKIAIAQTFALLSGVTNYSHIEGIFKSGKFLIKNRDWAEKVVGVFCPIRDMSPKINRTAFIQACMAACQVKYFDVSRMVYAAEKQRDRLVAYSTRDAYLEMMEEIYNKQRQAKFSHPLKFDAIEAMRRRNPCDIV